MIDHRSWEATGGSPDKSASKFAKTPNRAPFNPRWKKTRETPVNYTDESSAYAQLSLKTPRSHHTVSHSKKEWARDDDGDGIREVHSNTIEEFWTGLRNYLGSFLFIKDTVEKKIRVLSGGEKSRLALARMLVEPSHLLLLDEPTNHLDINPRDIIEYALQMDSGTLVCISHDRHFLNSVTNRTIEVKNNTIKSYAGNYDYFIWKSNHNISQKKDSESSELLKKKANIYEIKKIKRREYNKIQRRIDAIEIELNNINSELSNKDIQSNYEKLQSLDNIQNGLESEYLKLIEKQNDLEKWV